MSDLPVESARETSSPPTWIKSRFCMPWSRIWATGRYFVAPPSPSASV